MMMSAEFCRSQAAYHQQRAAESPLGNVREIEARAAATWEGEARAAEHRERRREIARAATEAKLRVRDDVAFSENPDNGLAPERASTEQTGNIQ